MSTRSVLVVFCVGSLLVGVLPPAAHAQDSSQRLAEQLRGEGGSPAGPPKAIILGLILTVTAMVILLVVLAAARNQKQQSDSRGAENAALKADSGGKGEATPAPEPDPEPEPVGGVARVKCPRCKQVVVDFVEMRRDALRCPSCSELLRPAPGSLDSAGGPGREEVGG